MIDKNFPAFMNLIQRLKTKYPQITGEVVRLVGRWEMNGCLDLQVTLKQDAPTEKLRDFDPGRYTIHLTYNPYQNGAWGPGGWEAKDYENFRGKLPLEVENDAYLKPNQTPYTRGFGEAYRERLVEKHGKYFTETMIAGYPGHDQWDGKRLLAGADYRVILAD